MPGGTLSTPNHISSCQRTVSLNGSRYARKKVKANHKDLSAITPGTLNF
jgi:hypothetical protein